mgnify:CR=1 FL=1
MNLEQPCIRISVRNLVEFILRHGDIDNRTGGADKEAMQQGGRIHRKIQRQQGAEYRAEVPLRYQIPCDGFILSVEGRADGIIELPKRVVVDEIKGVFKDLKRLKEPQLLHLAQAKCYAYIYAEQKNLEEIGVQMTYCNLDTEEIRRFQEVYTRAELKKWFEELVSEYEKWARYQMEWRAKRNASIKTVEFPFEYRDGQKKLVASVYRTILRKKKLFIQASTGTGKTMAVLYPAVKAIGEGLGDKIFYLTAKTITRTVAEQAFSILEEKGLAFRSITLTAKEKICFCEETECNPDACPYAKGHFDRVNDAVYDMLEKQKKLTRESIERQAEDFHVCPFELSLDLSEWADGVICDYNYVFDPTAHLKRFFADNVSGDYLFLIDEAHNLVERGREMYSASIYKEDILEVKKLMKDRDKKLVKSLESVNKLMLEMKRECENYRLVESVSPFAVKLMNLLTQMERYLEEERNAGNAEQPDAFMELFFQVRQFLEIHELLDENYIQYTELEGSGRFKVKLFCVNPAQNLNHYLSQGNSTIFFSATLLPIDYYKQLLSVEKDDYAVYAESKFPQENRKILIGSEASTKYTQRGTEMYRKIADYLRSTVDGKNGNYIAFFPSYQFMEDVLEEFEKLASGVELVIQSQFMSENQREEFLEMFEEERDHPMLGFCVMGGVFSEGIDLTHDRLIGVIVVGTGIPQVCNDREIVKNYFDQKGMRGFDYAYLYPGMNKVLQSAGRVIRTEDDKGIILLLDDRFQNRQYQQLFPREWKEYEVCGRKEIKEKMEEFWEKR